ncbi:MAG TPA: lipopolysaccharide assembly protein LapB [Gammaproteobacteria bacterium]|nr:lipopolysaccharide assembly protein LapB [Gammaproteobacteria bacterium]
MTELIWLLLPVAAASGWMAARSSFRREGKRSGFDVSSEYFKGLNYLLNEQPDKAIEVFIKMVEVDNDTVETHLALGSLFRRRGEVDRAIRIHQNLIARPTLNSEQRSHALLELGEDYMKAGLLDRAENLFQELLELNSHLPDALRNLIDIYQQEQEWEKAIETCSQYEKITGKSCGEIVAQYCCEMGEKAMHEGDQLKLHACIEQAFRHDKNCVRASILQGQKDQREGQYDKAIQNYEKVISQDIDYLPEVIDEIRECYLKLARPEEMDRLLDKILTLYDGITPILYKAEQLLGQGHGRQAMEFMVEQLRHKPSVKGLKWLVEQSLNRSEGKARENLNILRDLVATLLDDKPVYECLQCGFSGKSMHWQCPGCKQWNCVKPIKGVQAE